MTAPAGLAALDRWSLGYAAFALVVVSMRWPHAWSEAWLLVLPHVSLAVLSLAAPRLRRSRGAGPFFGEFYPLVATLALYTSIGLLNRAVGLAHDGLVQRWEEVLFGGQPSQAWAHAQPWPWLSTLLHAAYMAYYLILTGAPLGLWFSGRRDAARHTLFLMMATFYLCYGVFLLFPVAGPRYFLPPSDGPAKQVELARLMERILQGGDAWGTAFPSSHVAVALVAAVSAAWAWPRCGALLLPAALLLALGTVYGQFHYAVDALAGAAVAVLVLVAGRHTRP